MAVDSIAPNAAETNLRHMPDIDHREGIAEQMLAAWLCTYRRTVTGQLPAAQFPMTWPELAKDEIASVHYLALAKRAIELIWPNGR